MNVTVSMESSSQKRLSMKKFKSLNGLNYKEPMNSNFSDCTNEKLKELYAEDVEDDNEEEDVD